MIVKCINAIAPIRICDIGGWTDTWFARYGKVFNIAVYPYVETQVYVVDDDRMKSKISLNIESFDDEYVLNKKIVTRGMYGEKQYHAKDRDEWGKHPLIEYALTEMDLPENYHISINVHSEAPAGASMGTSASVSVALIGALDRLSEGTMTPHEVAKKAHDIEVRGLRLQCGVQDQLASAYGGMNYCDILDYPHTIVSPVYVNDNLWWEMEQRMSVFYIGTPHKSSDIHKKVIESMGEKPYCDSRICELRRLAEAAKNAVCAGDLNRFGNIMSENTEVQRRLHPDLVCDHFEKIIEISKDHGAIGWKVNGAGGDGGSISILFSKDMAKKRKMIRAVEESGYSYIPVYFSRKGLRVWESK